MQRGSTPNTELTTSSRRGSQFNFYAMQAELRSLDGVIQSLGGCILPWRFGNIKNSVLTQLPLDSREYIGNSVYVTPKILLDKIFTRFVKEQGFSVIQEDTSPVIEFSFPTIRKNTLYKGRLYSHWGYWGRDDWVAYDPILRETYKKLVSFLKKNVLTEEKHHKDPLSAGAIQFVEDGGELGNSL